MAFFVLDRGPLQCVVRCKQCERDVPAGVNATPANYITVKCILCGEVRKYLPTQVGAGYVHYEARKLLQKRGLR